ncbi:uncharacterized protein [Miscanthus floridulus]|uniref:uncharacterized protein n=1 Tax=Miscanthus floridulus TaxID=154761 RepID=UPI0034586E60
MRGGREGAAEWGGCDDGGARGAVVSAAFSDEHPGRGGGGEWLACPGRRPFSGDRPGRGGLWGRGGLGGRGGVRGQGAVKVEARRQEAEARRQLEARLAGTSGEGGAAGGAAPGEV